MQEGYLNITQQNKLTIRTSPGAIWWVRDENGTYPYKHGRLGGGGGGVHTAAEVADQIASRRGINIKEIATELRQLGWLEVLEHLTTLHHENIRREIDALQTKIENLRCFQKEYEGWTYQDFRNKVHEDLKASAGDAFDEDDVSVRRMHYAAQSLMGTADHIANLEGSIQRLQASLKEPL